MNHLDETIRKQTKIADAQVKGVSAQTKRINKLLAADGRRIIGREI
jgi:hypothetical protein